MSVAALEHRLAFIDHVWSKRELLAVEDEGGLVIVEIRRGKAAQLACCVDLLAH